MQWNRIRTEVTMQVFKRRNLMRSGAALMCGVALLVSAAWAYAAALDDNPGLVGILSDEVPDDLGEDALSVLGGNWQSWSEGVAGDIEKFYSGEAKDVAAQRKALAGLRAKDEVILKALGDARYRSLFGGLTDVHGSLVRRLDVCDAILDTLEQKAEDVKTAKLAKAREKLASAVSALESDLASVSGGSAWLPYVRAADIKAALKDGKSTDASYDASLSRLQARGSLTNEKQKEFLSRDSFAVLEQALTGLQKENQAEPPALDVPALRGALAELVKAIEAYESTNGAADGASLRASLEKAGSLALDGGDRLSDAVRRHYMNFNFQIVASEKFLSRLAHNEHSETGPVRDYILGANVGGTQRTTTVLSIDLKPSNSGMKMDMTIDGVTRSNTASATDQATIYTDGYHTFRAAKGVLFDGEKLVDEPARMIYVNPNNRTTGASTRYDGTLFAGFAEGVAEREAARRRPQSEAIAAQRLTSRVLPQFESRLGEELKKANERLQGDLKQRLQEGGIYPASVRIRSNESFVRYSSLVASGDELGGDVPNPGSASSSGAVAHIHESLINNSLNRMKFAGRTMTDDDIRKEIESHASRLLGREFKLTEPNAGAADDKTSTLVFADADPIRVQISGGNVNLVIRAGIKQEGKEDIPTQIVTVPISLRIDGEKIIIERGNVQVAPAAPPEDTAKQVVRAGVVRKKIEDAIGVRERDRTLKIAREGVGDIVVKLAEIKAVNGWLSVAAE